MSIILVLNLLAEKLPEERTQQQEEEIKYDQAVQSLSHKGLPALRKKLLISRAAGGHGWAVNLKTSI